MTLRLVLLHDRPERGRDRGPIGSFEALQTLVVLLSPQSSCDDVSETATDHASDVTEDFTVIHSPESPLGLEVISCAACGSSSASKICTVCGRGYHRDCHVPPFGPDIW